MVESPNPAGTVNAAATKAPKAAIMRTSSTCLVGD